MKYGPLLIILIFGLLIASVLVVVQTISSTISGVADAYSEVGVATTEQEGKTTRWSTVTGFLSGLFSGVTAAVI